MSMFTAPKPKGPSVGTGTNKWGKLPNIGNPGKGGKGNLFEQGRKKFEGIAGLDDEDVANRINTNDMFGKGPQESAFRADQTDFIKMLQAQASGQGPSLAQMVADQQRQQGLNQLLAMRASQRGANPALAARSNALASQNLTSSLAQQLQQGRLQEQMQARGQLGEALVQARAQDQAFQAQQQALNQAKAQAALQQALSRRDLNAQADIDARKGRREQLSNTRNFFQSFGTGIGQGKATTGALG